MFQPDFLKLFISYSVKLMYILDHFGYATQPLVEYHMTMFTDRASFMGWLSSLSERRRLEIILDPRASGPSLTKNKRVQVNMEEEVQESEPEVCTAKPSSSTEAKRPKRQASKRPRKVSESGSEEDTKPSKNKKKSKKAKGAPGLDPPVSGPTLVPMGRSQTRVESNPKQFSKGKAGGSDSDVQIQKDYEGHSDSLTDS